MFGFLLTLMILDALILAAVVLMQAGQGGGLASLGGGGVQAIGGRQLDQEDHPGDGAHGCLARGQGPAGRA